MVREAFCTVLQFDGPLENDLRGPEDKETDIRMCGPKGYNYWKAESRHAVDVNKRDRP